MDNLARAGLKIKDKGPGAVLAWSVPGSGSISQRLCVWGSLWPLEGECVRVSFPNPKTSGNLPQRRWSVLEALAAFEADGCLPSGRNFYRT